MGGGGGYFVTRLSRPILSSKFLDPWCETMTGESIRSDHIGVLLEVFQSRKESSITREKFIISKAKWDVWRD